MDEPDRCGCRAFAIGDASIESVGQEIYELILKIASGEEKNLG